MNTYEATATRDGKWWMVHIPELDGMTQARRYAEVELMAREWIASALDIELDEVAVEVRAEPVNGVDVAGALATIREDRSEAARLEREASDAAAALAKALAAADVPLRDIGAVMGVSFQRVHQLVTA